MSPSSIVQKPSIITKGSQLDEYKALIDSYLNQGWDDWLIIMKYIKAILGKKLNHSHYY